MTETLPPVIGIPLAVVLWAIVLAPHVRRAIARRHHKKENDHGRNVHPQP